LDGPALVWTATLHHNDHVHPDFFHGEGTAETFRFEPHAPNIFYAVCLTATDGTGRTAADCVNVYQAAEAPAGPASGVRRELWRDLGGSAIEDLTGEPAFPARPHTVETLATLDTSGQGKDYGERLTAYLTPPVDGEYRFWIAADDSGELWLSRDDDPAHALLIARTGAWTPKYAWEADPVQASAPIPLEGGRRYYIEVRHKQADQKDNVAVAWQIPGGDRVLIESAYLSPD
jgi:hypothetical protein